MASEQVGFCQPSIVRVLAGPSSNPVNAEEALLKKKGGWREDGKDQTDDPGNVKLSV